jgi:formylglycine-generating enzyme required for sulfatase activity
MARLVGLLLALALLPLPAVAEKRVALVIGNSGYKHASELANPRNDAEDMAAALRVLGIEVIKGLDLDKPTMDREIRKFSTALTGADVGIFFYAGHGLQVNGNNYLVPIDAELSTAAALEFEMVRLDLVQRVMEGEAKTNVLFLDACRNNPLSRNLARALGTRSTSIGRGLAAAESGVGTLISYSTQPGNVALDGQGRNSPYAGPLIKRIGTPGEDVLSVLTDVRNEVLAATGDQQVPWENHALRARFYFNGTTRNDQPPASEAERAWDRTKDTTSIALLETFIARYKGTYYADMARTRVEDLKQKIATAMPPASPPLARPSASCEGVEAQVGSERRCLKPKDTFKDCRDCPEMLMVAAGHFAMGSPESEPEREGWMKGTESPQHDVTIDKPLAVGRFAITRGEYAAFVRETNHAIGGKCWAHEGDKWEERSGRSFRNPGFSQDDRHPVVCVNWDDAKAYAAWLSKRTGKSYRLLSEAEREYVTRAGTTTPFWWGSSITPRQANYDGSADPYKGGGSKGEFRKRTMPVDSFEPNPWGIYQVHGNVLEWTEDCLNDTYQGAPTDGSAWTSGNCGLRMVRGGSWGGDPQYLRSAYRVADPAGLRYFHLGFRLARTLAP